MNKRIHLIGANLDNQNGMEYFVKRAFEKLGYTVYPTSYRKMNGKMVDLRIGTITDVDFILVIKGERVAPEPIYFAKVPSVLWMQDSIQVNQDALNVIETRAWAYKKVYTFDSEEIRYYKQFCLDTKYLPLAADLEIHKRTKIDKNIDIGFIGNLTGSRVHLIDRILQKYSVQYTHSFFNYVETINRTRINLNMGILPSGNQQRIFEVLSCGGFLLTNEIAKRGKLFKDKEHLVYFTDNNLLELIDYYLNNPYEMITISENGHKEIIEKHTWTYRVQKIINDIGKN